MMKKNQHASLLSPLAVIFALTLLPGVTGIAVAQDPPPNTTAPPNTTTPQNTTTPPNNTATPPKAPPKPALLPALPFVSNFHFWKGLMMVDTISTGNTPAQFILATGLNVNAVMPEDVPRLQIEVKDTKVHVTALDNTADAKQGQIKTITFGLHKEENIPAAVVDMMSLLSNTTPIDPPTGWLGAPFLSSFMLTLDFRNHQVIFDKPEAPFPKEVGVAVPIKVKEGRIYVKVTIPGAKSFDALVDTGAVGTFIPTEAATKLKLKATDFIPIVRHDGKPSKIGRALVAKFALGKLEMRGVQVAYYTKDATSVPNPDFAVIGMDLLRRYRVMISYKKQMMFFAPLNPMTPDQNSLNP